MITKKDVALKILQLGKAGFTTQEDGYKKLDECIDLIDRHVSEQLSIQGVSISLLKKYMIHVEQCEGVNFVSDIDRPWSKVEFTKEEITYLQKLDKEINESNEC
jgi:hypothetical protein